LQRMVVADGIAVEATTKETGLQVISLIMGAVAGHARSFVNRSANTGWCTLAVDALANRFDALAWTEFALFSALRLRSSHHAVLHLHQLTSAGSKRLRLFFLNVVAEVVAAEHFAEQTGLHVFFSVASALASHFGGVADVRNEFGLLAFGVDAVADAAAALTWMVRTVFQALRKRTTKKVLALLQQCKIAVAGTLFNDLTLSWGFGFAALKRRHLGNGDCFDVLQLVAMFVDAVAD